jgi:hypothetical protein
MKIKFAIKWFKKKSKPAEYLRATFLVPKREDPDVGNGSLHPPERWETLQEILYDKFNGWTILSESCRGGWQETPQKKVLDVSKNYCVHFESSKMNELIEIIKIVAVMFRQKCISFECCGKTQQIWQERHRQ